MIITSKLIAAFLLISAIGVAHSQSISISPSGNLRITTDDDLTGGQGRDSAPGQMKKEYGGSAKDYAPGQQNKDRDGSFNLNDDKRDSDWKSGKNSDRKINQKSKSDGKNKGSSKTSSGKSKNK